MTQVKDALNNSTYYNYDVSGNLTSVTDTRGNTTTYTYDEFNRLIEEKDANNDTVATYEYSNGGCTTCGGMGALTAKTDAKGVRIEYEYDNRNRLKKILYPGSDYVMFTYDANGNRLTMYDSRLNIGNKTFSYQYDVLNRVTRETYPNGDYIQYTYNTAGQRATIRLPNGSTQTYSYDSRGRLSSITHSLGNQNFNYSYASDDTLASITYPNENMNHFSYDILYRPSNIQVEDPKDMTYDVTYTYDAVGNRTRAEWDSGRGISTFMYIKIYNYDALNRLTIEKKMNQSETTRLYEYQYEFDAAGNRTQMTYFNGTSNETTTYNYNDLNQLTARSTHEMDYEYIYDNNRNLESEKDEGGAPIREFNWNNDNRLTSVEKGESEDPVVEYTYDALGRRIMRYDVANDTYTFYYYDGLTVIAEKEKIGSGSWSWKRIFTVAPGFIGQIFRISEWSGSAWTDTYYHYDAIGNVVLRTSSNGNVVEAIDQEAYGNVKIGSQTGYHLTTKEYDPLSELYYFFFRWYDLKIGRFNKIDPVFRLLVLTFPRVPFSEKHPYVYVGNSPINNVDPNGEIYWPCIVCVSYLGLPGIICGAICTTGYWDDPDESFGECFKKCLKCSIGAIPAGEHIAGIAACMACGYHGAEK